MTDAFTPNAADDNKFTAAKLDASLKDLAREKGRGKDSQVRALMLVVECAYHGGIDLVKDKHGPGRDDAVLRAELYVNEQARAVVFDAKADNHQKTVSCFRACIKVGSKTALGPGEPLTGMGELLEIRRRIKAQPGGNKLVDDAANTLLRWARAQERSTRPFTKDELEAIVRKKAPDIKTAEEYIAQTRKSLQKLAKGAACNGTAHDASPEILEAIGKLTERLTNIAKEKAADRANGA